MRPRKRIVSLFLLVFGFGLFAARTAHAIIGRPLTPFSYAGVARRTVRRSAYYGAATGGYGYPAAPYGGYPAAPYGYPGY
jgi:hypothetical protein